MPSPINAKVGTKALIQAAMKRLWAAGGRSSSASATDDRRRSEPFCKKRGSGARE
jgi:hypothetical protein